MIYLTSGRFYYVRGYRGRAKDIIYQYQAYAMTRTFVPHSFGLARMSLFPIG